MKILLYTFLFFLLSKSIYAQVIDVPLSGLMLDYSIRDSILFDDDSIGNVSTIPGGIWQIGTPVKSTFSSSWSADKAIITDTANAYPTNSNESFVIKFPYNIFESYENPALSFNHRLDIASGDTAFIEVSGDSIHWFSPYYFYPQGSGPLNSSIFSAELTAPSSMPYDYNYFTNTTTDWIQTSVWITYFIPVKDQIDSNLFFRFRFKSDNSAENRDGWMIDNVYFIHYSIWGSVEDQNKPKANLFPNPICGNQLFIECNEKPSKIEWFSSLGNLLSVYEGRFSEIPIPENIHNGNYWIKLYYSDGESEYKQVQIQR